MRFHMLLQITPLGKGLGAHCTTVRLLSRVDPYMSLKRIPPDEGLLTVLALVRPLPRVNHRMLLKVAQDAKFLRAHFALKLRRLA
jgi:hypothetical protein